MKRKVDDYEDPTNSTKRTNSVKQNHKRKKPNITPSQTTIENSVNRIFFEAYLEKLKSSHHKKTHKLSCTRFESIKSQFFEDGIGNYTKSYFESFLKI